MLLAYLQLAKHIVQNGTDFFTTHISESKFTRLKETEQKDLFLKIRGIDLTEIDNEYNEKYI